MVDLVEPDARRRQAVLDGVPGEPGIVLLAGEALLLGGGDDPAVVEQRGRAVVIERGQTENAHQQLTQKMV